MNELQFLTVQEFAKKINISDTQVRRWLDEGRVKGIKLSDNPRSPWRIPYTELRRIHAQAYEPDE